MENKSVDSNTRIQELEQLCAEMYQVAGSIGVPVRVLDQLSAAAAGKALPHETVLPFDAAECRPLPSIAAASLGRLNRGVTSRKKAKSSKLNGSLGGRPAKFQPGDVVICKVSAPVAIRNRKGIVVRKASDRAALFVRFEGEKQSATVRTWQIAKVVSPSARAAAKGH